MKLIRPEPIYIEREDGSAYRLDPPTRAQVRACLALDPSGDVEEAPLEIDARVSAQLRALVGDGAVRVDAQTHQPIAGAAPLPLDELSSDEEQQLIWALMARHLGHDPAHAVATQQALGKVFAPRLARGESNDTTPTASPSPSTSAEISEPQIGCPS